MPFVRADTEPIVFLQNCMPEQLKRVLIINAPKIFTFVWAVYKVFIDKKTRDKASAAITLQLPNVLISSESSMFRSSECLSWASH